MDTKSQYLFDLWDFDTGFEVVCVIEGEGTNGEADEDATPHGGCSKGDCPGFALEEARALAEVAETKRFVGGSAVAGASGGAAAGNRWGRAEGRSDELRMMPSKGCGRLTEN